MQSSKELKGEIRKPSAVTRTMPKTKKCKKARSLSEEALQIAEERTDAKGKGKGKDIPN